MFKILSFAVSVSVLSVMSMHAYAQSSPVLNLKNSGSMGYVPTVTKPITSNETTDLGVTTVTLDENRSLAVLGCGALDTHEARKSVLNVDTNTLNDYFNTSVSNYMVTTLFNSPAVAEIFNGLENFSGSRVRELQDRCAAMEYKDDLAPAQWASVQRCIDNYIDQDGGIPGNKNMAEAFKFCLSSPSYVNQGSESAVLLLDAANEVLSSRKWNGTLFSALENTRACINTTNGKRCDIFAFLPNIRWCSLTNKFSFKECGAENGGDPDGIDGPASGSGETIISAEAISPMQVFDASFGISRAFVNYANIYAEGMYKHLGKEASMQLAQMGENGRARLHIASTATETDVLAGSHGANRTIGSGALSTPTYSDMSFVNFVNCSATIDDTDPQWEDFSVISGIDASILADMPPNTFPPALGSNVIYGDFFDKSALTSSDSSLPQQESPTSYAGPSSGTIDAVYDPAYASSMIIAATKCAMRDELRLSLVDYIGLLDSPRSKDAAMLGYRTQVAYAATRNVLRFIIHRLQLAKLDLSFVVGTDPKSPPPHVILALQTIIDSLKDRLNETEDRRKHQKDYADIISKFHK